MTVRYDISIDDYHASPHLSASKLSDYAQRGPRFFASRHIQRVSPPFASSEAFVLGQSFEDLVQCPREWDARYVVRPEGLKFTTKEGKAWRDAQTLTIIDADDRKAMDAMLASLHENETAMAMIAASRTQATARAEYAGTPGIQSRPDWYSETGCAATGFEPFTLDLKTTLTLGKLTSWRGISEYRYHVQSALCRATIVCPRTYLSATTYLLAVEKVSPYRCQVIELTPEWNDAGWDWCRSQLDKLAGNYARNEWPRCDAEMITLPPPPPWVCHVGGDE